MSTSRLVALGPDPNNPRIHPPQQLRALEQIVKRTGIINPVVTDGKGNVLAGHLRLEVSKRLNHREIPTISIGHLSAHEQKLYAISDNRIPELAGWDKQLLGLELKALSDLDIDLDLTLTGFEIPEIDLLVENSKSSHSTNPADALPAAVDVLAPAISQKGDLWLLNRHRLLCGDALDQNSYAQLMNGGKSALVFTDPPYNVRIAGHAGGKGSTQHREFAMAAGEMSSAQFSGFLRTSFDRFIENSNPGSLHYICMDWRHIAEIHEAGKAYDELKNICVWTKDNAGMGSFYRSQHEFVFVFKQGGATHRNNIQLGRFGRNRSNVWSYPGANSFSRQTEEGDTLAFHPTVKPTQMIVDAILDCSARGDIVLDAFAGSGSSLLAAERVGRRFYGIELDPLYVDVAIKRWQRHTGDSAIHAASRARFNDLLSPEVE